MPMIDFSVVVLPAPLRPSSVATSPECTSKLTPCRMWDSPYQACRFFTVSAGAAAADSFMAGSHIGLAYFLISRNAGVIALRQHTPAREHRNAVGNSGNDAEVVLDHQDRAVGRYPLDERTDPLDVLVTHARGRLVQEQQ